jgi:hypothetical protein
MADPPAPPWLVLIHQLPPKPPYLRVKVWRRLQALGAVAIKNSVYVLPNTDDAREDFEWVLREIKKEGGDASLCEARLVDGITDDEVRGSFQTAREADYRALAGEIRDAARARLGARGRRIAEETRAPLDAALGRFRKRLDDIVRVDFFGAPGRAAVEGLVADLEERLASPDQRPQLRAARRWRAGDVRGRTWVTRTGVHIDRIASAWLIRRFIDPDARFRFVAPRQPVVESGDLRFDMFDAEFTHQGDCCTFEVLLREFGLDDPALHRLAGVVHDVDLKDAKFGAPEASGVDHLVAGIAWLHAGDEDRLRHGAAVFDALHEFFRRRAR